MYLYHICLTLPSMTFPILKIKLCLRHHLTHLRRSKQNCLHKTNWITIMKILKTKELDFVCLFKFWWRHIQICYVKRLNSFIVHFLLALCFHKFTFLYTRNEEIFESWNILSQNHTIAWKVKHHLINYEYLIRL